MVSMLAFYSDDPSSNPAEVYNFSVKLLLKSTKINKKRPGLANLKKKKINSPLKIIELFFRGCATNWSMRKS